MKRWIKTVGAEPHEHLSTREQEGIENMGEDLFYSCDNSDGTVNARNIENLAMAISQIRKHIREHCPVNCGGK